MIPQTGYSQSLESKCNCKKQKAQPAFASQLLSLLGGLGIALLPKCPFCILAFSGALGICGSPGLLPDYLLYGSTALFILLTFISIQLNFKGARTLWSLLVLAIGSSLVIASIWFLDWMAVYYFGAVLMLFAAWMNGSFWFFVNRLKGQN